MYFVLLMSFGNYVLFNLLVAILVEGFQESKEEERKQQVLCLHMSKTFLSLGQS